MRSVTVQVFGGEIDVYNPDIKINFGNPFPFVNCFKISDK